VQAQFQHTVGGIAHQLDGAVGKGHEPTFRRLKKRFCRFFRREVRARPGQGDVWRKTSDCVPRAEWICRSSMPSKH
jgi:hypothetical protein